jgi:hypothetical protein
MTRSEYRYRDRRREIERELADVPAPAPPADLLDAIRSEIPADLVTSSEPGGEQPRDLPRMVAFAFFSHRGGARVRDVRRGCDAPTE